MEVQHIRDTLRLAKAELDNCKETHDPEYHEKLFKSIDEVEKWLIEIGALPPR